MPHEVTVIKGRRFPTCRDCKGVRFELARAAKHVSEIEPFEEAHSPAFTRPPFQRLRSTR
jgi:hypothetical protein